MANLMVAAFLVIVFMVPDPPTEGFGVGLFGRAIMSWPTTNALVMTMAILNAVNGLKELIWS